MMFGSLPYRCSQREWLRMTRPFFPGWSSPSWNVRPIAAWTPKTRNQFAETDVPVRRTGKSPPVRLNSVLSVLAMRSIVRL